MLFLNMLLLLWMVMDVGLKRRGMPRSMGHRAGADVLKQIVIAADDIGIRALTVYGFSTENWKRPEQEVSLLMALIKEYFKQ